jgi:hypothetical protein
MSLLETSQQDAHPIVGGKQKQAQSGLLGYACLTCKLLVVCCVVERFPTSSWWIFSFGERMHQKMRPPSVSQKSETNNQDANASRESKNTYVSSNLY